MWVRFFIFVFAMLMTQPARADISYTFIKMTCDPASKSAAIQVFYDSGDSGRARLALHEQGVSPLGERDGNLTTKKGGCSLAQGYQKISFVAVQGALPRDDVLSVFLDGKKVGGGGLAYGGFTIRIQSTGEQDYTIRTCPEEPVAFFFNSPETASFEHPCVISYLVEGKLQRSEVIESSETSHDGVSK